MLTCTPRSFFSGDFEVSGCPGGAILHYQWLSDAGSIEFGGHAYRVRKEGWFSGLWVLELNGETIYAAQRGGFLSQTLTIRGQEMIFELRRGFMSRSYAAYISNTFVGSIDPGFWSRKMSGDIGSEVPVLGQLFALWIVELMRRKDSNAPAAP